PEPPLAVAHPRLDVARHPEHARGRARPAAPRAAARPGSVAAARRGPPAGPAPRASGAVEGRRIRALGAGPDATGGDRRGEEGDDDRVSQGMLHAADDARAARGAPLKAA